MKDNTRRFTNDMYGITATVEQSTSGRKPINNSQTYIVRLYDNCGLLVGAKFIEGQAAAIEYAKSLTKEY